MIEVARVTGASYSLKPIGEEGFKNISLLILTHILPHLVGPGLHLCERKDVVHHVLKNISRFDRSLEVRTYFHENGDLRLHGFHSCLSSNHLGPSFLEKETLISGKFIVNTLDSDFSWINKHFWICNKHVIYLAVLHKAFAKGQISIICVVRPSRYLLSQTWSNLLLRS